MHKEKGKIKVADITLAQLSRGLYRSNATVFKELVNNAYDADAVDVRINTNYPEFDFISCVDNGKGMPIKDFIHHFSEEGVGSSTKRKNNVEKTPIHKRPIIGRLGIGMMAIGQLCHSFEIESHYTCESGEKKAFKGRIILTDENIPFITEQERTSDFTGKDIDVGEWSCEQIDFDEEKKGFRIYSSDVRGTFRREMKKSFEEIDPKTLPFSLNKIIDILYKKSSVRECLPYLETIWELANLCPLPYLENEYSPINFYKNKIIEVKDDRVIKFISERQKKLKSYNFNLYFDGIKLRRLVQLPTDDDVEKCVLYFIDFKNQVFDNTLQFKGYIFSQISKAIRPQELYGIQIRLRNVGIGEHDKTYLKYYNQIETIRSRWISGELFVDEGLEMALNIDRDSFNEHEEHYKKLQSFLHDRLNDIFNETRKIAISVNRQNREIRVNDLYENLKNIVIEESKGKFQLLETEVPNSREHIIFDKENGKIIINSNSKVLKKQKGDKIFKLVEIAYLLSDSMANNSQERHKKFSQFIKKVLEELA